MSLLLDALRRAEEARRAKEAESNSASATGSTNKPDPASSPPSIDFPALELALEEEPPLPPAANSGSSAQQTELLPFNAYDDSELSLEALVAPPAAAPPPPKIAQVATLVAPPPTPQPIASQHNVAQQEMARTIFAAKQPNSQLTRETGNRKWLLPVVTVIVVVLGAGGWYVWREIDKMSKPAVARASSPPPSALAAAAPNTGQIVGKQVVLAEVAPKVEPPPRPPLLPPQAIDSPPPKLALVSTTERAMTEREALAKKLKDAPIANEPEVGLKLSRSVQPARIKPDLTAAYNSLVAGDYPAAVLQYKNWSQPNH